MSSDPSPADPPADRPGAAIDTARRVRAWPPWPVRWLLLGLAVASLAVGIVGIFVPGLPTAVFVLISAWCADRASPRFHAWLLGNRVFGPIIRDWQDGGRVSRRSKRAAALWMSISAVVLLVFAEPFWAAVAIGMMGGVLTWLWRKPER